MKKCKGVIFAGLLVGLALIMGSCSFGQDADSKISDTTIERVREERLSNIPFENEYVLKSFSNDPQILDFNTARRLALVEFLAKEMDVDMGWEGHRMKPVPVVIYGFDNRPRFYDFIVVDAEEHAVGTITVYARRQASTSIHAISSGIRDYRSILTKGASFEGSLFVDWSGRSFVGLRGRAGDIPDLVIDAVTGEVVTGIREIEGKEIINEIMTMGMYDMLTGRPNIEDLDIDEDHPYFEEIMQWILSGGENAITPEELEALLIASLANHND